MSVHLAAIGNAFQFFNTNGRPLASGLLYTFAAGTSTPQTTYSDNAGAVPNTNPIVLAADGRVTNEIWLTDATAYKFVLKTSGGVTIGTYDNLIGIGDQSGLIASLAASGGSALVGFLQAGGGTLRTVQSKLRDTVNVMDFGAVGNGVTNDTGAFVAAFNYCMNSASHSVIECNGDFVFTPTSLPLGSATKKVTLLVNGVLRPTTTITVDEHLAIHGVGGANANLVQFTIGECCQIVKPVGNIPVIKVTGSADHVLRNIAISSCYQGVYCDGASALGSLIRMENVNVLSDVAGGNALVVDAFFWGWFENCKFLATTTAVKSILITNTSIAFSAAGLLFFKDCITATRGVSVNPAVGNCGNIYFYNHHHESLAVGEDFFFAKSASYNITFCQLGLSDSAVGAGFGFDVAGVTGFKCDNSYQQTFRNPPTSGVMDIDSPFYYSNTPLDILSERDHVFGTTHGAISARVLSRGVSNAVMRCVGTPIAITVPTGAIGGASGIVVTAGQQAPDGGTTAYLVQPAGANPAADYAGNIYNFNQTFAVGEWYLVTMMVKAVLDTVGSSGEGAGPVAFGVGNPASTTITIPYEVQYAVNVAGTVGPDSHLKDDGWIPVAAYFKVVTAPVNPNSLVVTMHSSGSSSYYIWKPSIRQIPAAYNFSASDMVKMVQGTAVLPDSPTGVVAILEHETLRTGQNITASRPAAAAVGKGSQFYDTTLNIPIWSDGANWKNAAGAVV